MSNSYYFFLPRMVGSSGLGLDFLSTWSRVWILTKSLMGGDNPPMSAKRFFGGLWTNLKKNLRDQPGYSFAIIYRSY